MKQHFFAILATAAVLGFTSCSKEDPATPLNVNQEQTATAHGTILIVDNEDNNPQKWTAPTAAQINITATVPYNKLNSLASGGDYIVPQSNITYVPSTGEFTIKYPASLLGTTVKVNIDAFKGSVKKAGGKSVDVIWSKQTVTSPTLYPGNIGYFQPLELQGAYTIVTVPGDEL